jgi:hypothetical protein
MFVAAGPHIISFSGQTHHNKATEPLAGKLAFGGEQLPAVENLKKNKKSLACTKQQNVSCVNRLAVNHGKV